MLRHGHDLQRLTDTAMRSPQRTTVATVAVAVVAAWWFFLGSATVSAQVQAGTLSPSALAALGVLTAINFGALIISALAVRLDRPIAKVFVVVVVAINVPLAFWNLVGPLDIAYGVAALIALALVLWSWRRDSR